MAAVPAPRLGSVVEIKIKVTDGSVNQRGILRFFGPTEFAPGIWAGVELPSPNGKNNGSVQGVTYFTCPPNHGVFCKQNQIALVEQPQSPPAPARAPARASRATPTSPPPSTRAPTIRTHVRNSSAGLKARPPSLLSPTTSSSPSSRSGTPPKPSKPTLLPPGSVAKRGRAGSTAVPPQSRTDPASVASQSRAVASPPPPAVKRTPALGIRPPAKAFSRSPNGGTSPLPESPAVRDPPPTAAIPIPLSKTVKRLASPPPPVQRRSPSPPPVPSSASYTGSSFKGINISPTALKSQGISTSPTALRAQGISTSPTALKSQGISLSPTALKPPSRPLSPPAAQQKPPDPPKPQDDTENQELRAKIRVLEAKRADDARHIRELETRLTEAESFVTLRPKLQAKLASLQTELTATKRELADAQQLAGLAEGRVGDTQEQLEMAMLDKEVAEERADLAEGELEKVREKLAVVEVELGVLKNGGAAVAEGDGSTDAKSSLSYIQLEKQNERLKEALIRLRDLSQETEHDHRRRIAEMEKDVMSVDDLQSQYETALIKLSNAEVQIEDLKLQLDDALGAEEMLVQLTERNLMLGEKIEEMRITIEDLEALKELNDELEENHVETEKSMQEELDLKDAQIREQMRRAEALEEACLDLESTITQFRELVLQLQSELDQLRTETQTAQHESATAVSQTAAMMSLNLKLQSSASKNQAKNIELEIKKLEARETKELLSIVQPYLPQLYVETDSDATSCYLFFLRLAYKADLINNVVAQSHHLPESLDGVVPDVLVGVCEMRGRIASLSILCKRFAAILRRCDVESFLNIGRIFPDIALIEKRVDMHIDLLRRDEFREMECVSDVIKIQAQFDHLAETYFSGFEHDLGERELGYSLSFDHDLDVFAASIGLTKTAVAAILDDQDAMIDLGDLDPDAELFEPLQTLLDQCKSAKVLSRKLTKRLEDLIGNSAALKGHLLPQLKALSDAVPELVNFGISLAQQIMPYLSDVRGAKSIFELTSVLAFVQQTVISTVAKDMRPDVSPWEAVGESILRLVQEAGKLLPQAMEPENAAKITGTPPWVTRIAQIKAALAVNVEAERKVGQLNDEMQSLARSLKAKDQNIQEAGVKIELMERRMEAMKKQADMIVELENELAKAGKQERAYEEAMEQLQADLDVLEQNNAKLKALAASPERQLAGAPQQESETVAVEANLETSHLLELNEALRGTVRFLRTENSYLKGQDLLREIESLPPLPAPIGRSPTPQLDPSGLSDSEDSDSETEFRRTPPTVRSLATETKLLYREVIKFSTSPRVVDLSSLNARRAEAKGGKIWMPKNRTPGHHVWERKMEAERLSRRVRGLLDKASAIGDGIR